MPYFEYLPLIVLGGVFYWQYRKYSRRSFANAVDGIPVGVGGWLFVLVCVMLVAIPLNSFVVIQEILEKLYSNNGGAYNGAWFTIAILFFTEMVSIVGGWGLAKGNTPNVVTRAKIALWVQAIVGALILPIGMDGGIALFRSLIVATVWTLYLSKSKRVKATYNIKSSPPIAKEMSVIPVATQGTKLPAVGFTPEKAIVFRFLQFAWAGRFRQRLLIALSIMLAFLIIGILSRWGSNKAASQPELSDQARYESEQALHEAVRSVIGGDASRSRIGSLLKQATEGDSNAQYARNEDSNLTESISRNFSAGPITVSTYGKCNPIMTECKSYVVLHHDAQLMKIDSAGSVSHPISEKDVAWIGGHYVSIAYHTGGTGWLTEGFDVAALEDGRLYYLGKYHGFKDGYWVTLYSDLEINDITSHATAPSWKLYFKSFQGKAILNVGKTCEAAKLKYDFDKTKLWNALSSNRRVSSSSQEDRWWLEDNVEAPLLGALALSRYCGWQSDYMDILTRAKASHALVTSDLLQKLNLELLKIQPAG